MNQSYENNKQYLDTINQEVEEVSNA